MDMVVELNEKGPAKGIEMSVVKQSACKPFVYPTPFELHFSVAHLDWYGKNPDDYVSKMKGEDKDLAAECVRYEKIQKTYLPHTHPNHLIRKFKKAF